MATINIRLDKRGNRPDKHGRFNLSVIVQHQGEVLYLNVDKLTEQQYNHVFVKRSLDDKSKEYRQRCDEFLDKAEKVFTKVIPFDRQQFREEFFKEEVVEPVTKITPTQMTYFEMAEYFRENKRLKPASKNRMKTARNQLEKFKPGLTYKDITVKFLHDFEHEVTKRGGSPATISGYMTDIRTVINYHRNITKFIPQDYEYPFGAGGYGIKTYFPSKVVLRAEEIQAIAELTEFETKEQEWARDIWLFLYRCNGINFVDLLAMRWDHIKGGSFRFYRTKTKTTRRSNIKPIVAPITDKLQEVLDKISVKDSPFIIGKMKDGYSDTTLSNKSHKLCGEINKELKYVTQKLGLSLNLVLDIARDSYATTLNRNGRSINHIAEHLGHATTVVTQHYVGQLTVEQSKEINSCLF
ncbi:tyrosine-type recombinase/integrase [Aquirufa aurantiipilula]|uniref:Phage integrase SAM-like domain-containing protein n=1 Tax=Aquirufa aurantiipilula TaxID=2696561 RepID=A0ABT6BJB5_9BACT|nr:phage integrase SAM-like domain-containing protein [Aquirufa aurantiipilula]MDF5690300.1 phage integrase SAM-like domain-containing protein [Aquirufa aurantiipilula]